MYLFIKMNYHNTKRLNKFTVNLKGQKEKFNFKQKSRGSEL